MVEGTRVFNLGKRIQIEIDRKIRYVLCEAERQKLGQKVKFMGNMYIGLVLKNSGQYLLYWEINRINFWGRLISSLV